jgi:CheY-like chemotaxis protein
MMTMLPPALDVLLVEDDPGDELLTREALADQRVPHRLHVVRDGQAAIDFLYRFGEHEDAPRPDLIILDLNLPKFSGHEVLKQIKADARLTHIPVVVLSTSQAQEDVMGSYRNHANAYIAKPTDFDDYARAVQQIEAFFAGIAQLPPRRG